MVPSGKSGDGITGCQFDSRMSLEENLNEMCIRDRTKGEEVTAFGICPKLSDTPGKVWRGAPSLGQDTETILKEIVGCSEEEINSLKEEKLI